MQVYEYKLDGSKAQFAAIDGAIRVVQFIRNKCLCLWMDEHNIAYGLMHGVPVIAVAPQFTSQQCSACRAMVKKSLSMRTHICPSCGVVLDRDHNAAQNILAKAFACTLGHRETAGSPENAWGEMASIRTPKRATSKSPR